MRIEVFSYFYLCNCHLYIEAVMPIKLCEVLQMYPSGCKPIKIERKSDMVSDLLDTAEMMMGMVVVPMIDMMAVPAAKMYEKSRG